MEDEELDHVGPVTEAGQGHREELPQELVQNIRELLAVRPQGLEVEALPLVYSQYGSLGRREPEELCVSLTLAGVCGYREGEGGQGARILPTFSKQKRVAGANDLAKPLVDDVMRVLRSSGGRVEEELFLEKYLETTGHNLDLQVLGFPGVPSFFRSLHTAGLVELEEGAIRLRVTREADCREVRVRVRVVEAGAEEQLGGEELWRLEREMEAHYSYTEGALDPELVRVGREVVYLAPDSGLWLRARVTEVRGGKARLLRLDYGGQVRLPVSWLRPLEPRFSLLPAQGKEGDTVVGGGRDGKVKSVRVNGWEEEVLLRVILEALARSEEALV